MIESISLHNFQSHEDTMFQLHPGINAIIGASDKGKSAVLRGLSWVVFNRPSGDGFISDWAKTEKGAIQAGKAARVTLRMDGREVVRERSSERNSYIVDGQEFDAVRADVPEAVTEALRMGEVNVQRQHDAPFLVSASAGEVARFFNRQVRLDDIDTAHKLIDSKKRDAVAAVRAADTALYDAEQDLSALEWVPRAEAAIAGVVALQEDCARLRAETSRMNSEILEGRRILRKMRDLADVMDLRREADACAKISDRIGRVSAEYNKLHKAQRAGVQATRELSETAWARTAAPAADRLASLLSVRKTQLERARDISEAVDRHSAARRASESAAWAKDAQTRADLAGKALEAVESAKQRLRGLRWAISEHKGSLEMLRRTDWAAGARSLVDKCGEIEARRAIIGQKVRNIRADLDEVADMETQRRTARRDMKTLRASLPETCPTCGAPWSEKCT